MISFVIATRDRGEELARTAGMLGSLDAGAIERACGAEVVVIDNASREPVRLPTSLANGIRVRCERVGENLGAAARNLAAEEACGEWLVMLDDDSSVLSEAFVDVLAGLPSDVAAVGGHITLPNGRRERGGLPEVFVGCGAAVRRCAFLEAGGYDAGFGYYVEEYDLCAKLIAGGWSIRHADRFRVEHRKVSAGRAMDRILHRLARNTITVWARHAPAGLDDPALGLELERIEGVALRERAFDGYRRGRVEGEASAGDQRRTPMGPDEWDRFIGLAAVREHLGDAVRMRGIGSASLIGRDKHAWCIERALGELGVDVVEEGELPVEGAQIIGTLAPGPLLDIWEREPHALPSWRPFARDRSFIAASA